MPRLLKQPTSDAPRNAPRVIPKWVDLALLLAVFMVGLTLRLYALDADSLWLDEIFTASTARLDLGSIPSYLATSDHTPPLLYLCTGLAVDLWGNSEFIIRLPAALLGSASILLVYKVGEILWGPKEGLVAAFLLCVNAYHVEYSQEARFYAPMVFLALLSLIFLLKALEQGQKRMWALFAVCTTLNLYNQYTAFPIFGGQLLFAAWVVIHDWRLSRRVRPHVNLESHAPINLDHQVTASRDQPPPVDPSAAPPRPLPDARHQALCLLAAVTLVGISYIPWLPSLVQQLHDPALGYEGLGIGTLPRSEFSVAFFTQALKLYTQVDGSFLLLVLVLFGLGLATSQVRHIVLVGLLIVTPFLTPFIIRSGHFFSYRYAIFVVPILLLGMARGMAFLGNLLARRLRALRDHHRVRGVLYSVVTVSVFGALAVTPVTDYYLGEKDDYRGVAHYLQQTVQPGDVVVTDGMRYQRGQDAEWTQYCMSYYMDYYHVEQTPILPVERGLWASLQEVAHSDGEVFAVLSSRQERASWDNQTEFTIIDFKSLYVVRLPQPSGDLRQDTVAMLEAVAELFRVSPTAGFDARLALAEAYADLGEQAQADSQIVLASTLMPDRDQAADDLAATIDELQPILRVQLENVRLGETLAMRGRSVYPTTLRAGEAVDITLWWEVVSRIDQDYTAFVHILAPDGTVVAQEDRLLQSSARPTSGWRAGEVLTDEYQIPLPADVQPGQYIIKTGVYYWKTGERLPVWDSEGQRVPEDALVLPPVSVVAID